jgi:starvation-inducible outer membrane lipoprotein
MQMSLKPLVLSLALVLSACSSGPSDSEIQQALDEQVRRAQEVASMGGTPVPPMKFDMKVLNKAKQGDDWLIEIETTATLDESKATDYQKSQFEQIGSMKSRETAKFVKGEDGWMIVKN